MMMAPCLSPSCVSFKAQIVEATAQFAAVSFANNASTPPPYSAQLGLPLSHDEPIRVGLHPCLLYTSDAADD